MSGVYQGWRGARAEPDFGSRCFPSGEDLSLSVVSLCVFMGGFLFEG